MGGQPFVADGPAAPLAAAVGAGSHPFLGPVEIDQAGPGLVEEAGHLGPLEADGRTLGIVLVVGVGVGRGVDDRLQVAGEVVDLALEAPALGDEGVLHGHRGNRYPRTRG